MPRVGLREHGQALWDESERIYRARLLDAVPPIDGRLLDVGCDDGEWTEQVRTRARVAPDAVAGIEVVPARRSLAEARGFTVRDGDLEQRWPYDDGEFELVHANQVIEHVKRLDHFVLEAKRVLQPEGRFLVCTENLASWHNVVALLLGWMPFTLTNISSTGSIGNPLSLHPESGGHGESWQHIHVVTLRALVDLLEAHGFAVEERFAVGWYPLRGRAARWAAGVNPGHGHFIGVRARLPA
jgi:SAM-dependent methyltransferase